MVLDSKWKLDALLGVGGMAAVYAATHRNGARAAIKFLPFSLATGPEVCQRLLREGYLANKIQHNAVVRVLDDHIDYDKEYAYIVMELLDGETTRQRLERTGSFGPLQAIELMLELCDCLRAAHQAQVIHRDIKPENLFLTKQGLKVLDFGIARALDGNSSLTQTGTSLGTPAYMSPEQARGKQKEVTARSDIYAVGATMLFMLSGETLHEGDSPMELMVRAAWTPAPRARKLCPTLPEPIAAVIDRCCAFDPNDRYPDAEAVMTALQGVYRRLSSTPPPIFNPIRLAPPETAHELRQPQRYNHLAETIDAESVTEKPAAATSSRRLWFVAASAATLLLGSWSWLRSAAVTAPAAPIDASLEASPVSDVAAQAAIAREAPALAPPIAATTDSQSAAAKKAAPLAVKAAGSAPRQRAKTTPPSPTASGTPAANLPREALTSAPPVPAKPAKESNRIDIDYSGVGSR
jgi:serine/threonine-protein kinase